MQGRAAAGAVRGLQPSIPGRSHAAQAVRARFACTGTSAPPAWCCCCVLACHRARAGALQPSIIGHPCGLTGRQAGQATQTRGVQGVRADRQARRALRNCSKHVHGQGPPDRAARCGVRRPGICDHASACSNARGGALALRCKWIDDRCSFALSHSSVHAFQDSFPWLRCCVQACDHASALQQHLQMADARWPLFNCCALVCCF